MLIRLNGAEVRVVNEPILRYAPSGIAVTSFTAVASKSKKNEATGEWENEAELWIRVTAFKELAEHVAESITKGMTVIVNGPVKQSEWEDKDGNKRTSFECTADNIGVAIRYGTAKFTKADRNNTAAPAAGDNPWDSSSSDDSIPF